METVSHLIRQEWNVTTICKDPKLDDGLVVVSFVVVGDGVGASFLRVEPLDEA